MISPCISTLSSATALRSISTRQQWVWVRVRWQVIELDLTMASFKKTLREKTLKMASLGLRLQMFVDVAEYLPTSEAAGVRITVHPSDEQPFPDTVGFSAPVGTVSSFGIHLVRFGVVSFQTLRYRKALNACLIPTETVSTTV